MSGALIWLAAALAAAAAALLAGPGPPAAPRSRGPAPPRAGPVPAGPEGVARFRTVLSPVSGTGAALVVSGPVGLALGLVVMVVVWQVVTGMEPPSRRRRREQLQASLPITVDLLATCLSAGSSPSSAVALVARATGGPMADELGAVTARFELGVDPLRVWSDVSHHPQLAPLGRCLVRAIESGASVADAMSRLAEDLRRTARADVEARARGVGVRAAAPLGVCLLPAFILIGIVPLVAGSIGVVMSF